MQIPDSYSSSKERIRSAVATFVVFSLLLLFLFFYKLITPNPPFPEGGGGGGMTMSLGLTEFGSDEINFREIGKAQQIITEEEYKNQTSDKLLQDASSDIEVPMNEKPQEKKEAVKPKPVVIKEAIPNKSEAELLAEKFKKNQGKSGGGNTEIVGQQGIPSGSYDGSGAGGQGGGAGSGMGKDDGAGSGPGRESGLGGGVRFTLSGRKITKPPPVPKDAQEEGIVVVDITVDAEGNVIEANPNGRGTTTNSALLKAKARQAALATKFNKMDAGPAEQHGTITFVFSFD